MKAFIMDTLTLSPLSRVPKKELFAAFVKYCEKNKLAAVTSDTFFKNLPIYFAKNPLQESREEVAPGHRERYFIGIELRPEKEWGKSELEIGEAKIKQNPGQNGQDGQTDLGSVQGGQGVQGSGIPKEGSTKRKARLIYPRCEDCDKELGKEDEPTVYTIDKKHYCKVHFLARKQSEPQQENEQP